MPPSHPSLHPSPRRGPAGGLRGQAAGRDEGGAGCRGHAARPLPRARPAGQPRVPAGHGEQARGTAGPGGKRRRQGRAPLAGSTAAARPFPARRSPPRPRGVSLPRVRPRGTAPGPSEPAGQGTGQAGLGRGPWRGGGAGAGGDGGGKGQREGRWLRLARPGAVPWGRPALSCNRP